MTSKRPNGSSSDDTAIEGSSSTHWTALAKRGLTRASKWDDKDDLLDVLYWGRQGLALIVGLSWGFLQLHGAVAIGLYVLISTLAGQQWVVSYQAVDEDTVGGFWEIAKEGFGAAFSTFLVSWIAVYSALQETAY